MTVMTKRDAVDAAMSVAQDVAEGRLDPVTLQQQAMTEMREMFGSVVGEGDPAWPVQLDVARQVLGLGGIPADELSEWLAVARHRAGEAVEASRPLAPAIDLVPAESSGSEALGPDSGAFETDVDPAVEPEPVVVPEIAVIEALPDVVTTPQHRADEYDAFRGWNPGGSRRV